MKKNLDKTNSSYRFGCFHVGRTDMWGNYCPETGEYYLACNAIDPVIGEYIHTVASCRCDCDEGGYIDENGHFHQYYEDEYTYEVVRELLQLGHLTKSTLASYIEAGGDVWWDQPNYRN